MNYGQFLNMVPEASLVAILIILFFADFALSKSEKKHPVLRYLTVELLLLQLVDADHQPTAMGTATAKPYPTAATAIY